MSFLRCRKLLVQQQGQVPELPGCESPRCGVWSAFEWPTFSNFTPSTDQLSHFQLHNSGVHLWSPLPAQTPAFLEKCESFCSAKLETTVALHSV